MCGASSEQFVFAIEYENQAGSPETMPFFTQHHIPLSLLVLICEPCWCCSLWGSCRVRGSRSRRERSLTQPAGQPPLPVPAPQPGVAHIQQELAHPSWPLQRMGGWGSRQALGEPGKTRQCFVSHAHRCLCLSGKLCQAQELLMLLPLFLDPVSVPACIFSYINYPSAWPRACDRGNEAEHEFS